jgi:hypothetical protein
MQHSTLTENFLIIQSYGGAFLFKLQRKAEGRGQMAEGKKKYK